jgi:hypothetical protein
MPRNDGTKRRLSKKRRKKRDALRLKHQQQKRKAA